MFLMAKKEKIRIKTSENLNPKQEQQNKQEQNKEQNKKQNRREF